jgi:hypothetical protein
MKRNAKSLRRKAIAFTAATLLTTAGLTGVTSSPASAAWSSCPVEAICLYPALDGVGVPDILFLPTFGCRQLAQGARNNAESVWNRAGETAWLRDGDNCSGSQYSVLNGARVSHLGSFRNLTNSVETR